MPASLPDICKAEALTRLKRGEKPSRVARTLKVDITTINKWRADALLCKRCGLDLQKPDPEDLCGFCRHERGLVTA